MKCEVFGTIKNAAMDTENLNENVKGSTEKEQDLWVECILCMPSTHIS